MPGKAPGVRLPRRLHKALLAHGRSAPVVEVCGLLGGRADHLGSFYPVRNVAEHPERSFLLEAEGQIEAMRRMRETGETLRGIFHTHPDAPAVPSATDLAQAAYPDIYYLILSLAGAEPELAAYHYDGRKFTPAELLIE